MTPIDEMRFSNDAVALMSDLDDRITRLLSQKALEIARRKGQTIVTRQHVYEAVQEVIQFLKSQLRGAGDLQEA
jgi:predicted ATP-dependent protease